MPRLIRFLVTLGFVFIALFPRLLLARPLTLSLSPVLDHNVLNDPAELVLLRNAILAELSETYECVVLTRSNGIPLFEEQRRLALASLDPQTFPYPPAADFLLIPELSKKSGTVVLGINYTAITGRKNSKVLRHELTFGSVSELIETAADRTVRELEDLLSLQKRPVASTIPQMLEGKEWAVLPWLDLGRDDGIATDSSERLTDLSAELLARELPKAKMLSEANVEEASLSYYAGATEQVAAAVGHELGVDYLLTGNVTTASSELWLNLFIVRAQDALVLAAREIRAKDMEEAVDTLEFAIPAMLQSIPSIPVLEESPAAKNLEEARILWELARRLGKELWARNQALDLILAARMVAQDTYGELGALH
ncbi:hypothetical protein [Coraliomargarita parva]|uniref:hypothetical protein n=1 Tax=Coraliomargarita parva TaxID=3014050 RepID=UPI0022B41D89|nr:hypothetical protein [Coraliomargarita parva]